MFEINKKITANLPLDLEGRFFIQIALCLCCSNAESDVWLSEFGNCAQLAWDGTVLLFELP